MTTPAPPGAYAGAGPAAGDRMQIDRRDEDQQQQERPIRILEPTSTKVPPHQAYARADAFPEGTATATYLRQVEADLADTTFEIKKGTPKVVVLKTRNEGVWKKLVDEGLEVTAKGKKEKVPFRDYATKSTDSDSDLEDIFVSGVPRGMSVTAVGSQLAAQVGKPVTELSEGCTRLRGTFRSTIAFRVHSCAGIKDVIKRGHFFVSKTMLRVFTEETRPNRDAQQKTTLGLYGLPPGTMDQNLLELLSDYDCPLPRAVQVMRRGPEQRLTRAAAVVFADDGACEEVLAIRFGTGPLKGATWAPIDGKACYLCGKTDHLAATCPGAKHRPRPAQVPRKADSPKRAHTDSQVCNGASWAEAAGARPRSRSQPKEQEQQQQQQLQAVDEDAVAKKVVELLVQSGSVIVQKEPESGLHADVRQLKANMMECKNEVTQLHQAIAERDAVIEEQNAMIAEQQATIARLEAALAMTHAEPSEDQGYQGRYVMAEASDNDTGANTSFVQAPTTAASTAAPATTHQPSHVHPAQKRASSDVTSIRNDTQNGQQRLSGPPAPTLRLTRSTAAAQAAPRHSDAACPGSTTSHPAGSTGRAAAPPARSQ